MVCPCSGITVQIKNQIDKEQTIDTCNNLDGSQGIMVKEKKANLKKLHILYFNLCIILEMMELKKWRTYLWLEKEGGVTLKYLQRVPLC